MRSLLFPVILCLATGSALADAPFVPPGVSPPDYVATKIWNSDGQPRRRTVAHHGDWTRVDQGMTTEYFSANGVANVRVFGEGPSISFERGRVLPDYHDNEPRNTGERRTHLGEGCTVWDVWRTKRERGQELSHLSCITDDGIEVWQNVSGPDDVNASAVTGRVERGQLRRPSSSPRARFWYWIGGTRLRSLSERRPSPIMRRSWSFPTIPPRRENQSERHAGLVRGNLSKKRLTVRAAASESRTILSACGCTTPVANPACRRGSPSREQTQRRRTAQG